MKEIEFFNRPRLKVLSGFFANLAAGWFGAIFVVPNFVDLTLVSDVLILIADGLGVVASLFLAFILEEESERLT